MSFSVALGKDGICFRLYSRYRYNAFSISPETSWNHNRIEVSPQSHFSESTSLELWEFTPPWSPSLPHSGGLYPGQAVGISRCFHTDCVQFRPTTSLTNLLHQCHSFSRGECLDQSHDFCTDPSQCIYICEYHLTLLLCFPGD